MTERKKSASGEDFDLTLFARGKNAVQLSINGNCRFYLGRVTLEEKFSETGSLEKKLRRHDSADMLTVGLESLNILPFGCEYAIARDFEIADGFAVFSEDISAMHFGRVGSLELEPLTFTGTPAEVEYITAGEKKFRKVVLDGEKEIYNSTSPLLLLKVSWADGSAVEYSVGTDYWRHCAAENVKEASSEFTLYFDGKDLVYNRRVLIYSAEAEPEKRPWRFKNLLSWNSGTPSPAPEPESSFSVPGCQVDPAARRTVRKKVRSARGNIAMLNASPCICAEAAHVERPGRTGFTHFDLAEYVAFHMWANRQLKKSGGSLVIKPAEKTIFNQTVTMQNLQRVPRPLTCNYEEEEDV